MTPTSKATVPLFATNHRGVQADAKELFKNCAPSVFVIIANDSNGKPQALGSGFAVGDHLIATNYHVIHNSFGVNIYSSLNHQAFSLVGVRGIDGINDLAVLEVSDTLAPLKLKTSIVDVGEPVFAIGNPMGLDATLSSGLVSGLRVQDGTNKYQISAPISPGSSGGPVLISDSEVIGVSSSYLEDGQNLNFAVNASHLSDLMLKGLYPSALAVDKCSGTELKSGQKTAIEAVTVTGPNWSGNYDYIYKDGEFGSLQFDDERTTYKIKFDLSINNGSDKTVTQVDLQILFYDSDGQNMIDSERESISVQVDPHLAKRTSFTIGNLHFNTFPSNGWRALFRILDYSSN